MKFSPQNKCSMPHSLVSCDIIVSKTMHGLNASWGCQIKMEKKMRWTIMQDLCTELSYGTRDRWKFQNEVIKMTCFETASVLAWVNRKKDEWTTSLGEIWMTAPLSWFYINGQNVILNLYCHKHDKDFPNGDTSFPQGSWELEFGGDQYYVL